MPIPAASTVLNHLKVLDLTRVRAGPTAVRQLADWGADVIKIEVPDSAGGDGGLGGARHGPDFQNLHRNKRSIEINFKTEDGLAIFRKMVADADVVVENYRPDVKTRLGIDYESLKQVNPRIIYASISGFGQDGPYVARPGVDQIAQGMAGLMSITGRRGEGPMRVGIPIADLTAGLLTAQGILLAVIEREKSGEGQWVRASLLEAQLFMLDFQAARWLMEEDIAPQVGNEHPTAVPTDAYETADGYMNVAAAGDRMYGRFCDAMGRPDLKDHSDFISGKRRFQNRDALNEIIKVEMKKQPTDYWIEVLNEAGVPSGPINNIGEAFQDPQVRHLGIAQTTTGEVVGEITLVGQPITMSRSKAKLAIGAPEKGAHTDEILTEFGYSADEIAAFKNSEAV